MARYRKVDPIIWNDEKFRVLSVEAKLSFLFLLTHPHMTMLGAMRETIPGLAAELAMPEKDFREAFREALAKGMIKADESASFIWLPNFLKYNKPESPNVVVSWSEALLLIPECQLKRQLIQQVKDFAEGLTKGFREALPEAFRKTMPIQEQEQEQEQYLKDNSSSSEKSQSILPVESYELAELLRMRIAERDPKSNAARMSDVTDWAKHIDMLMRINGRAANDIKDVIEWCQKPGCFWAPNIMSGKKLREKFDTIYGQMKKESVNGTNSQHSKPSAVAAIQPGYTPKQRNLQ